jgi:hypothetical protein
MKYPINHHVLSDLTREHGEKGELSENDVNWLLNSLHRMCNAYDEIVDNDFGYWVVGMTETATRLAICNSHDQAAEYIGGQENNEDGIYYIDGPCLGTIELRERDGKV